MAGLAGLGFGSSEELESQARSVVLAALREEVEAGQQVRDGAAGWEDFERVARDVEARVEAALVAPFGENWLSRRRAGGR